MPAEPQTTGPIPASAAPAVPTPTPIENKRSDRSLHSTCARDARYLDTPYYVIPRDQVGKEAFAVIRDATRSKDVVGMGRVVLARRERPIIVEPMGNGIRGITLRRSRMSGTKPPTCQHSKCVT
jgi:DNA end-binding protein Ku